MPTDRSEAIQVNGLAAFQRELRRIDLAKDLRLANLAAAELVAGKARSRAAGLGGVAAKTAPSIKAAAEQRRAKVTLGGPRFPFAMGAEFGGQGRPTTQQFQPHRGRTGYALYPTIRDTREEFIEVMARSLDELMRRAFPD
jgi:hypothetical protein